VLDRIVFKDVWLKNDAEAETDSIVAWQSAGDRLGRLTDMERAKLLSIVAYDGAPICATVTTQVRYMAMVRENMAFMQIFVAPAYRTKGIVIPLTVAFHAAMTRYALENPQLRIGGTAGRVTVHGTLDKPVGGAGMILFGYSVDNDPMMVRWFDHYRIDEEAARARDPRRANIPVQE
jgi:hypothetical protein